MMSWLLYYSVFIPGAVVCGMLVYAFIQWELGNRPQAIHWAQNAAQVFLMVLVVATLFWAAGYLSYTVIQAMGGEEAKRAAEEMAGLTGWERINLMWESLPEAAGTFNDTYRICVKWIRAIAEAGAVLATPIVTAPLADVLRAATTWEVWAFSAASNVLLAMTWFTTVLKYLHPWLLAFGAALTVSDRMRTIGGGLLAIYLVMGAFVYGTSLYVNQQALQNEEFNNPPVIEEGSIPNPLDIAAKADGAANIAIHVTIFTLVMMSIAGLLTAGVSSALGSMAVMLRPGV